MLNRKKIINGVLVEIGFVSIFIIALVGLSWLI
ncbi:MAG: hypothetical protein K0R09_1280 [Clostridiales bacterium]|jgi:hypothetical protein|nr:hypothetical protein [Clostridiales bacterium]